MSYPSETGTGPRDWPIYRQGVIRRFANANEPYPNPTSDIWNYRPAFDIGAGMDIEEAFAKHWKDLEDALPHEAPPPPPPANVLRPIVGTVSLIDGGRRGIQDANGPRLIMGCHAGDLLSRFYRDQKTALAALDAISAAGHQFVRTWTVLPGPWWAARTGEIHPGLPGYWDAVHAYCQALKARSLRWQVSQGDMCRHYPDQFTRRRYMQDLAQTLKEEGGTDQLVLSVDAGNEAWQNGEQDADKLNDCLDAFLAVLPVPLAMTTSARDEGTLNDYIRSKSTCTCYHNSRFTFRHATERAWTVGYWDGKGRSFAIDDEPAGVNHVDGIDKVGAHVSSMESPADWRELEVMGTYALAHLLSRQAYTLMLSPGVISDEPFDSYEALAHAPKVAALLPDDVQSWRIFHGGDGRSFSPERVVGVSGGNVRCEHAKADDGRVAVLIYVDKPCHVDLPIYNNFEGVIITPDETLAKHPIALTAGQKFGVDLRRGRLLLGKYV